jgi:MFS family permease
MPRHIALSRQPVPSCSSSIERRVANPPDHFYIVSFRISKANNMKNRQTTSALPSWKLFFFFCFGSYLLSMSYGTTFLLSLLIVARGGSEADVGMVISIAMLSTFAAVLLSGHLTDSIGAAKAIACSGVALAAACFGFALTGSFGASLLACGLILGLGWGVFYTLGPIIVAMMIEPARRAAYFAILSGSMMSGIGSGPLIGRALTASGFAISSAFYVAALASLLGAAVFWFLHPAIRRRQALSGVAPSHRITWRASVAILRSKAVLSIVMVGLGACIFGGLSSFQTSYASLHGLDYALFFAGFMCAVIACRLFVSGFVVKCDAYLSSCILSGLTMVSMLLFLCFVHSSFSYVLAAVLLGIGYGLTYSVINGLVANESPHGLTSQALLLFSLAYFLGVFGFPLLAGKIIVHWGMQAFLLSLLALTVLNWLITVVRLVWSRYFLVLQHE